MKKHLLFLFTALTLLLVPTALKAQTTVTIGDGSTSYYYMPVNMYFNYSLNQQIYTADEINMPDGGTITSISFDYAYDQSFTMSGVRVYMKNVSKNTFEDDDDIVEVSYEDKVFEGTFSASGAGWVTLTLSTPFHYDGTSNLLVCFYDPTSGYPGSSYTFRTTPTPSGQPLALNWYSDSYCPDLDDLSSFSGNKHQRTYRNNIQLTINPDQGDIVTIGGGTTTTLAGFFASGYAYSFVEQIYTADEIAKPEGGVITGFRFNLESASSEPDHLTIFMKNVPRSSFAANIDYETVSSSDIVFEGFVEYATGWNTITLDVPFAYNGTDNLMIAVYDNTGLYNGLSFYSTTLSQYQWWGRGNFTNEGEGSPYDYNSWSNGPWRNYDRADVQLVFENGSSDHALTLNDGSATSEFIPVSGYWADTYLKTEFVMPSSSLADLSNTNITGMTFYSTSDYQNVSWSGAHFLVFMKEVGNTTIDSYTGYSDATVVYEGDLSIVDGLMNIPFTTPYAYNGGNLLIGVYNTATGNYNSCSWVGVYAEGASINGYSYNSLDNVSANQMDFLPKTTFSYEISHIDFENKDISDYDFANDATYPWIRVDAANGCDNGSAYCMRSGNAGVANSSSTIQITHNFPSGGSISFDAKCMGEGTSTFWDHCDFLIDGAQIFTHGADISDWQNYMITVTPGSHTFTWTYTKDGSVNPTGDGFFVDNIEFNYQLPCVAPNNLIVEQTDNTHFTVSWDPVTGAPGYDVEIAGMTIPFTVTETYTTFESSFPENVSQMVRVRTHCNGSNVSDWAETTFTPMIIHSTANWYGFALELADDQPWQNHFVHFTMQDPATVTQASSDLGHYYTFGAAYANGYVWCLNGDGDLVRATLDNTNHIISGFETIVSGMENNCMSMSYNPNNGLIYYINTSLQLLSFSPDDPENTLTTVGSFSYLYITSLAINQAGEAYCVDNNGFLYQLNLNNASVTSVGNTGLGSVYVQSLAFDLETNELFWSERHDNNVGFYKVDPATAKVAFLGQIGGGDGCQLVGLFMGSDATPICPAPTNLYVDGLTSDNAILHWTENGSATAWSVRIATTSDLSDDIFYDATAQSYDFSHSLTPGTTYYVEVQSSCEGGWSSVFSSVLTFTTPSGTTEPLVEIGSGTGTGEFLPTSTFYNYSLTQQIYTAAEIGQAGDIYSVAFYNTSSAATRDIDVYMVHTNSASFSGGGVWTAVTSDDLVFSGAVDFLSNDWSVIEFTTPFSYNGTDNLLLVVDDNTGDYDDDRFFKTFDAPGQAMRIYSDYTNFNPSNPGEYTGTVMDVKNQIRLGFAPIPCQKPTNLAVSNIGPHSAELSWTDPAGGYEWEYECSTSDDFSTVIESDFVNDATLQLIGLTPETTYYARVRNSCGTLGFSSWSTPVSFTTLEPCPEPSDLAAFYISANGANVSWTGFGDSYNLRYGVTEAPTMATVILTAPDVWGDGSGYQMLLDADANTFGTIIPTSQGLTSSGDASAETYAEFEYKIPVNADGSLTTSNIVFDNSVSILIPAGTYDWCITNPTPGDRVWIASTGGNIPGRYDDFVFEPGKTYEFVLADYGVNDGVDLSVSFSSDVEEWFVVNGVTSPHTLTGLTPETMYVFQVQSDCGSDGMSGWSNTGSFTTTNATACPAPTNLYVDGLTSDNAILHWTENGSATAWSVRFATTVDFSDDVYYDATTQSYDFSHSLTPGTTYYVEVQSSCEGGWSSVFSSVLTFTTPSGTTEPLVEIGSCSTGSSYLPSYSFYNYSLTQQIYTAAEVGQAGDISSVAFYNIGSTKIRIYDVYLVHTDKSAFSGSTDWVPVTAADRVFSGAVNMDAGDWTTLEFDNMFHYNGTQNLLLVVDDNTDSYSSGMSCFAFDAESQALRIYSDGIDYDPYDPSTYTGTLMNVKNCVQFTFGPILCHKPTNLTVSNIGKTSATLNWTENGTATEWQVCVNGDEAGAITVTTTPYTLTGLTAETEYTVKVRANCGGSDGVSAWSAIKTFTTLPSCFAPTNLTVSNVTQNTAILEWTENDEATEWEICVNGDEANVVTASTNPYTLTGLTPGTENTVKVRANCGGSDGVSAWSNVQTFFTISDIPILSTANWYGYATYSLDGQDWDNKFISFSMQDPAMVSAATSTTLPTTYAAAYADGYVWFITQGGGNLCRTTLDNVQKTINVAYVTVVQGFESNTARTMAYNPADGYFYYINGNQELLRFAPANPNQVVSVGTMSETIMTLAINAAGEAYGVELTTGALYQIDLTNATATLVGNTEQNCNYVQDMAFDLTTGELFWAQIYSTTDVGLYKVDPATAETYYLGQVGGGSGAEITGLFMGYDYEITCLAPSNLAVSNVGPTSAELSWTENGTATEWTYQLSTDPTFPTEMTEELNIADNPYPLTGLTPETTYWVRVSAHCGSENGESLWTPGMSFTTTVVCPAPYDIEVTNITTNSAELTWTGFGDQYAVRYGPVLFFDDFENGLGQWTQIDADGDGNGWRLGSDLFTPNAHSGSDIVLSESYRNSYGALTPDNYLVTPQITLGGTVMFWVKAQDPSYPEEHFGIAVSTAGNTDATDFTTIAEWTMTAGDWQQYTVDLSAYAGQQGYVALRHFGCTDMYCLDIDDFVITGDPSSWTTVITTDASVVLDGLTPGTPYEVQVQSDCGSDGTSEWSAPAFFTTSAVSCLAPSGLTVTNVTKHTAELSWTENGTATEWQIILNNDDANIIDITTNPYILEGLDAETEYTVQVRANCGSTWSDWSTETTFTTEIGCSATEDLTVMDVTYNATTFTWTGEGSSFNMRFRAISDEWVLIEDILPAFTLEDLMPGTDYEVQVQNNCGTEGLSEWSNMVTFTTLMCPIPSGLTVTNVTKHTAELSWTENGTATEWQIILNNDDANIIDITTNPYILEGLDAETEYTVQVRANCGSDWSEWSTEAIFTTEIGCAATEDLTVMDVTYDAATFTWTGEASSFNMRFRAISDEWVLIEDILPAFTLEDLMSGTDYEVQVQNNCGTEGLSEWSNMVTFTTLMCPIPSDLTVTNVTKHSAELSWTENGTATEWQIILNNDDANIIDITTNPYILEGLDAETEYTVQVRANCGSDWSEWSTEAIFTTEIGCAATEDLTVMDVTYNAATFTWTGEGTSFNLQFKTPGDEWVLVEEILPPFTLEDLMPETDYEVQVQNICGTDGLSEWSNLATFTTQMCPVPSELTVTNITKHSAEVSWTENGTATEWQIILNHDDATLTLVNTNPYTLEGLVAGTDYTVQVQANCGNTWSDWSTEATFTTEVSFVPTYATITGESTVCQGHVTTLTANTDVAATYHWSNGSTDKYIYVGAGTYTVTVTSTTGEELVSDAFTVTEKPSFAVEESRTICPSELPYVWNGVTFTDFGMEYVTLTAANGCDSIVTMYLSLYPTYNTPIEAEICEGDSYNFFGDMLTTADTYTHTLQSKDGCDSVITLTLTVNPTYNTPVEAEICEGGSYIFFDQILTTEGVYIHTLQTAAGCDSVITLTLTVNPTYNTPVTAEICQGSSYDFFGQTLTTEGTYTHTLESQSGCDSVITLTLTVNPTYNTPVAASICQGDSYDFFGETLTVADIYTHTLEAANGCDSVITLTLTVNPTYEVAETRDVCPAGLPYTWNGVTFTEAGTQTATLPTVNGCDSVVTMTLTVSDAYTLTENRIVCESELPVIWNEYTFTEAGTHDVTLTAANGCDSVVTMVLTVNPTYAETDAKTVCASELPYTWNGVTFTEAGTQTATLPTVNGCDSVVTMTLTVNPIAESAEAIAICQSELPYTWNDVTFTEAGTQTATLEAANGCDSIVTMTLTVKPTYAITEKRSVCITELPYDWNGVTFTSSSVQNVTLEAENGCDSVVTMILTVTYPQTSSDSRTVCASELPYTWNGITFPAAGTQYATFEGSNGCDSTVAMTLIVNPIFNTPVSAEICLGNSYDFFGETLTAAGTYTHTLEAVNGCDSVITLTLTVNTPVHAATTAESCGSYTWNEQTYTETGVYTYSHEDAHGCTQVDTLHLTIFNPVHTAVNAESCGSFLWNGQTYTETGVYTYTHEDAHGCTQVDTLHLTIFNPVHTAVNAESCGSYTWAANGETYTESDTYTYEHQDAHGCTQVDTLYLTIYTPTNTAITETACGSYTWTGGDGVTYTESGTHYYEHPDAHGCTQVDTLYLTIYNPVAEVVETSACGNYTWAANGQTYYVSGEYTYSHQDVHSCTQVDTLRLTILQGSSAVLANTICASELPYEWNGVTFTAAGMQTATLTAVNGCDSVVTMVLTVNASPVNTAITATECGSYTWAANGQTYYESGEYTYAHPDVNGCMQVDTLHLTIYNPVAEVVETSECVSYTWAANGQTYYESGEYTYAHTDAHGCTQVDTLHLTIYTPEHTAITVAECGSYSWTGGTGITYTESGTYYYEHQDAHGCTQVDTLYLTIYNPVAEVVEASACGSYTWAANGQTYAVSGEYTYSHTDAHGCTQVDTLRLTILQGSSAVLTSTICASELPYVWNGVTFTEAGMQTTTLTAANGCDSVVTMVLTVNAPPVNTAIIATECGSYTWAANGQTYYESGVYTYSHPDVNGCTQVDTLYLTIHNPVNTAVTVSECGSYTWNGQTYTTSGVYTYSHTDANGCTQVDTLYLTISQSVQVELYETACGSYTWNGQTYTQSNDYSATFTAANGCDSIVVLHLTINNPVNTAITVEECDSYTWTTGNGQTYTTSGDYTYSHVDDNGCTQVDTLHLTIHYATSSEFTIETPDSCYTWNGQTYCASGDYVQTLQTVNGCDSVVTLHLTTSVGVSDHEVTMVFLAPNPTQNICRIMGLETDPVSVDLYDMRGKLVMKASGRELDVTTLPTGLYMVKIFTGDRFINLKLVKQ